MPIDLEDLFGSKDKVKILRFFLNHDQTNVSLSELQKTLKIKRVTLNSEIKKLKNLGLLKEIKRYSALAARCLVHALHARRLAAKHSSDPKLVREFRSDMRSFAQSYVRWVKWAMWEVVE